MNRTQRHEDTAGSAGCAEAAASELPSSAFEHALEVLGRGLLATESAGSPAARRRRRRSCALFAAVAVFLIAVTATVAQYAAHCGVFAAVAPVVRNPLFARLEGPG